MLGGLVSSFWSCGGLWVRYCVYVWECYLEPSQRECLTPQFLTLSFQLWAFIVCSGALVGTYLAYGQSTLDLLSSLSTGLNSSLYPLACGGGWGWVWYEEGRGMKGKGRGWAFSLSLLSFGTASISSDLGFCFLPNIQLSWLPAQVGEGERTYFLQVLSENNPVGAA